MDVLVPILPQLLVLAGQLAIAGAQVWADRRAAVSAAGLLKTPLAQPGSVA